MSDYVSTGMFWFSLAVITAGLAEQKRRSRLAWFFVSLLLGPIATLCVVMSAPPAPVPDALPPARA
ncbi:hypothetical protein JD292_10910 [Leucobacter sp. CSA2]|uniref:Antitermination protein NusB n=1 Tax=Leucobacter edaphi TaxID=2796472 RepID=A0A934QDG0_9MICO|nr:hypothetical protein [Leucobacter edaphi]MBK0422580.1 hypothetical protein [Leucobacter edaphi]